MDETAALAELIKRLSRLQAQVQKVVKSIRAADDDPLMVMRGLQGLDQLKGLDPEVDRLSRELTTLWAARVDELLLTADATIRELCEVNRWTLDGQWPSYFVQRAVALEFDDKVNRFKIENESVDGFSREAMTRLLSAQIVTLIPKSFISSKFLEQMYAAYKCLTDEHKQVPIGDILKQMIVDAQPRGFWSAPKKKPFVVITIAQFRARLSHILLEDELVIDGHRLQLYPPLDPKSAFFIYLPAEERFGYIGRVEFSRDTV